MLELRTGGADDYLALTVPDRCPAPAEKLSPPRCAARSGAACGRWRSTRTRAAHGRGSAVPFAPEFALLEMLARAGTALSRMTAGLSGLLDGTACSSESTSPRSKKQDRRRFGVQLITRAGRGPRRARGRGRGVVRPRARGLAVAVRAERLRSVAKAELKSTRCSSMFYRVSSDIRSSTLVADMDAVRPVVCVGVSSLVAPIARRLQAQVSAGDLSGGCASGTHPAVTGVAGSIGNHRELAASRRARGDRVSIRSAEHLCLGHKSGQRTAASRVMGQWRSVAGDPLSDLSGALEGVDAVVHLAGEPGVPASWGGAFPIYVERNVIAAQRLLEAAATAGVGRSSTHRARRSTVRRTRHWSRRGAAAAQSVRRASSPARSWSAPTPSSAGCPRWPSPYFSVYGPRQRRTWRRTEFIEALLDHRPVPSTATASRSATSPSWPTSSRRRPRP